MKNQPVVNEEAGIGFSATMPEDMLTIRQDLSGEFPADPIICAITRMRATLLLVNHHLSDEAGGRLPDSVLSDALWSVEGMLSTVEKIVSHHGGYFNSGI